MIKKRKIRESGIKRLWMNKNLRTIGFSFVGSMIASIYLLYFLPPNNTGEPVDNTGINRRGKNFSSSGIASGCNLKIKDVTVKSEEQTFTSTYRDKETKRQKKVLVKEINVPGNSGIAIVVKAAGIVTKRDPGHAEISVYLYLDGHLRKSTSGVCNEISMPEICTVLSEKITVVPGSHRIKIVGWFTGNIKNTKIVFERFTIIEIIEQTITERIKK